MSPSLKFSTLNQLRFDNRFIRELPADLEPRNFRRQVLGACYSSVLPKPVLNPRLLAYSRDMAELLDLSPVLCASDAFVQVFVGNCLSEGMEAYATCYGGHQFGQWAGQLGDGRAINLGDVINQRGERWALQLKGAGPTPYSRNADGLAVLRSSVREFLCSEAMYHLGVPTTRALSVILTGETVIRDMFYDGNPQAEPGAVVCRVAPSFTRFGHFQILAARDDTELLRQFLDYTIRVDFPHLGEPSEDIYCQWFNEVCTRTAEMIVHWQRVGFVHGVMNTDNMSILGLTIDYGPYGWLENYDPKWTPNTTDSAEHRYCYGRQPAIGFWNLEQLANAIYPLIQDAKPLQQAMDNYVTQFDEGWQLMMVHKLGLEGINSVAVAELNKTLIENLKQVETDMTIFFRQLATLDTEGQFELDPLWQHRLRPAYYVESQLTSDYWAKLEQWLKGYTKVLQNVGLADSRRRENMNAVNPKYVLRNYLAQLAIDKAETGDFSMVHDLLEVLRQPYAEQPEKEHYAEKRPDWARQRAGCSMLSCSS